MERSGGLGSGNRGATQHYLEPFLSPERPPLAPSNLTCHPPNPVTLQTGRNWTLPPDWTAKGPFPRLKFTRGSSHSSSAQHRTAPHSTFGGRLLATQPFHTDCPHLPFLPFKYQLPQLSMPRLYGLADTNCLTRDGNRSSPSSTWPGFPGIPSLNLPHQPHLFHLPIQPRLCIHKLSLLRHCHCRRQALPVECCRMASNQSRM